jgi:ABC-type bacteriocin/lantibiotic exporter with double-glycine peptidase domain
MCGGIGVLLYYLGRGALVGLVGMLAFVAWGVIMQERAHKLEKNVVQLRDQRLRLLKRVIDGNKAVKYTAWEEQYIEVMNAARNAECEALRRYRIAYVSTISAGKGFPPICAMLTIIVTAALNDWSISAADAFATVAVFQTIRIGVILIPMATGLLGSVLIAFDRCARYLCMPERSDMKNASDGLAVEVGNLCIDFSSTIESTESPLGPSPISFKMLVPTLSVPFGEVVAIVGAVGGGKFFKNKLC